MIHGLAAVFREEDLVAGLRAAGVELALLLVVVGGAGAASPHPLLGLAEQLQAQFQAEGLDEAPVREDVAPGIAVLLAVVDHTQGIQITGIFVPVPVPGVGRLIIEMGVGLLLNVADFGSGRGQQSINRLHGHHPLRQ